MGDTNKDGNEDEVTPVPVSDMTRDELHAKFKEVTEGVASAVAKAKDDLTGADIAAKVVAEAELKELRAAFAVLGEDVEVDTAPLEPVAEITPTEGESEVAPVAEITPAEGDEGGPRELTDADADLVAASAAAHRAAAAPEGAAPEAGPSAVQPLMVAGLDGIMSPVNTDATVMQASADGGEVTVWQEELADSFARATSKSGEQPVFESGRRSAETPIMQRNTTAMMAAEIMGLTGDLNRADACNPRYINDTESCLATPADEAQAWIQKFAMSGECEVKTKRPQGTTAPDFFEWGYNEDLGTGAKTGLIVGGDIPVPYDRANELSWKPLSQLTTTCLEDTHRLRSVGYIREIDRGQDLCDPAAVERAMRDDAAYLEGLKAQAVIAAFDADAAAAHTHTFDGVTEFKNPKQALAYLFGEVNTPVENVHGVSVSDSTLFLPSNIASLFNIARYESLVDNTAFTVDMIADIAGVGSVVLTRGIVATGGLDPNVAVPNGAIDATTLARTRTIPMYRAWGANWRQGQGPGVRGTVTSDEMNMRGNKRLVMFEDDLVNIPFGCLATEKYTATLCFQGGSLVSTAPVAC